MVKSRSRTAIDALAQSSTVFISIQDNQSQESPFSILVNLIRERYDSGTQYLKNRSEQMVYLAKLRLKFGEKWKEEDGAQEMIEGYGSQNKQKWSYVRSNQQKILGEFNEKLPPDQIKKVFEFLQQLTNWKLLEAFQKFSKRVFQRRGRKFNFLKTKYESMSKLQNKQ